MLRLDDDSLAQESWELFAKHRIAAPYPNIKGMKTSYEYVAATRPDVYKHKPEEFIDSSFVEELDKSGFIKKLYEKVICRHESSHRDSARTMADSRHPPDAILDLIDYFEALDVDSLWVSDRLVSSALTLEPVTFLSYIAGHLRKMKFGTSTLVLPTRNPIVLAKELATLDFLSQGRLFPAIGLGGDESKDLQAVGVEQKRARGRADEMIVLMRRLWTEENVTFERKIFFRRKRHHHATTVAEKRPADLDRRAQRSGAATNRAFRRRLVGLVGVAGGSRSGDQIDSQLRRRSWTASSRKIIMAC